MKTLIIIILFFPISSIFGQTNLEKKDTIIDFWNHQTYERLNGYENRVVEDRNKILYVKISQKGRSEPNFEYFWSNDSVFYSIEYYLSGNQKSTGNFIISNQISAKIDTLTSENPMNPADFIQTFIYFREIVKIGKWRESSDYCCIDKYGDYWEGEYINGKRTGIWKHYTSSFSNIEIERINYNQDSLKSIYVNNVGATIRIDSLENILRGRWIVSTCEDSKTSRMLFYKCLSYKGNYGDDCNNSYSKANYYDFIDKTNFKRQRGEGCNEFKESSTTAKWKIIRENSETYIFINFIGSSENWKFKLIYLDRKGTLVTERQ